MSFPSNPVNLSGKMRMHIQLLLERLTRSEFEAMFGHFTDRSSLGGPVDATIEVVDVFDDAALAAEAAAIAAGPLFAAELVSLGWTAP